ncbi:MAG TPA: glycosyltransferase family 4 protein [Kiloniellales bacterium]|nr:glycosyltransferase family 4 protein [Kiloniellales bacterium]
MAEPKTAALFFHDDAFDVTSKEIVGRRMAGLAFLKALVLHEPEPSISVYTISRVQLARLEKLVPKLAKGRRTRLKILEYIKFGRLDKLAKVGGVFRADAAIDDFAWMRRRAGATAFSITGVTHTLSSAPTQAAIADQLLAPLESWDALICTSLAARRVVENIHEEQAQYLAERVGSATSLRPRLQLPVIPLGVHCEDFDTGTKDMQLLRGQARRSYGVGAQDLCFLFVGRLTQYSKANPLPMLRALQRAAERTRRSLHLFQVGIFPKKSIETAYRDAATRYAPDVRCHFVDGNDDAAMRAARAAADVFTSLADNLQETFGLTPLEAMASGLPVVVSDWNGYRETVRDGVDGILVPTTMTPPGYGDEMALRHYARIDDYMHFAGETALNVAVDEGAAADAYVALIRDAGLRQRMGEAGRRRARETFAWERIYGLYRELWGELVERRGSAAQSRSQRPALPAHPDPFRAYRHFATRSFELSTEVALAEGVAIGAWRAMAKEPLLMLGGGYPLAESELDAIYGQLVAAGPTTVRALSELFARERRDQAIRTISWLLKADLVRLVNPTVIPDRPAPFEGDLR